MRLFFLVLLTAYSVIAAPQNPILSRYRIEPKSPSAMNRIADKYEVVRREGKKFQVIVPRDEAKNLIQLTLSHELLEADLAASVRSAWAVTDGYHNFTTVQSELKSIEATHPTLARLEQYGQSMEGRPLLALRVTGKDTPNKAEIMLTAATHGDELITVEVLLGILNQLVTGYGTNTRLTNILDNSVIYFIPVVNPDGYVRQERYANGVDPNRDYPWPESPNRNPNPCIKNIIAFFHNHKILGSIDFHASGEMIMYPWAYTYSPVSSELHQALDKITSDMAQTNGYVHGQISEVIYVAKGSSADYYLWKNNALALGIEMAQSKIPSTSQIPSILQDNTESTWRYLESFVGCRDCH